MTLGGMGVGVAVVEGKGAGVQVGVKVPDAVDVGLGVALKMSDGVMLIVAVSSAWVIDGATSRASEIGGVLDGMLHPI